MPTESQPTQNLTPNSSTDSTFIDRRSNDSNGRPPGVERRQFANSYTELSPNAKELAEAIDKYKIHHRRRFITYEEMLNVITSLGYQKVST
jgi:hypothetical protein